MNPEAIFAQLSAQGVFWCEPHFLSLAQCSLWLERVQTYPTQAAESEGQGTIRRSRLLQAPQEANLAIKALVEPLAPLWEQHFQRSLRRQEQWDFLRYDVGDAFGFHRDWADAPIYRERQISVILLLNDPHGQVHYPYRGGVLSFFISHPQDPQKYLGVPILPRAGMLLAFDSRLFHAVSPVRSGQRFSVVSWLAS